METSNVFKMRKIALVSLYTSIIFLLMGRVSIIFGIIGGIGLIIFFYLSLVYWKCPTCKRRLPIRHGSIDSATFCPYCGKELNLDIEDKDLVKDKRNVLLGLAGVVIVISIILILFIGNEHIKKKRIEEITTKTLDILKENEEVNKRIGNSFTVINNTRKIMDNRYLITIQGNKKFMWVWVGIDGNNQIDRIEVQWGNNDKDSILISDDN